MELPADNKPRTDFDRIPALHGVRGLAVLYVVVSHLGNFGLYLLPVRHDGIGKVGVWTFFALSAFLLTSRLELEIRRASSPWGALAAYSIHRVFRIFPLYVPVLFIHFTVGNISLARLIEHLKLVDGRGHLWAVPVELRYYLVIPLVAAVGAYRPRWVPFLLGAALIGAFAYSLRFPGLVFSHEITILPKLAPFLLGSWLARVLAADPALPARRFTRAALPAVLVLLVVVTCLYHSASNLRLGVPAIPWLSLAMGVAAAGLIFTAHQQTLFTRMLASRPLVYLGQISFSLYLLHTFAIHLVNGLLVSPAIPPAVRGWSALMLAIIASGISYRLVEDPGIRVGKLLGRKVRGRGHE